MIAAKTGLFDLQVVAGTIESDDDLILGAPVGLAGPDHSVIIEVRASQVTRCRVAGEDGERWDVAIGVEHGRADRADESRSDDLAATAASDRSGEVVAV